MKIKTEKLCVVNSSGGLDSSTLMRKALDEGFKILPIALMNSLISINIVSTSALEKSTNAS